MKSFRTDHLLTLYFFRPLLRVLQRDTELPIPILMYHSISNEKETGHPYFWINTSPVLFAQQMQFLYDKNYQVISLSEAVDLLSVGNSNTKPHIQPLNHSTTQRKFVVLTFDDGYRDFYTEAFPILKKYGFSATVFLPTAFIDNKVPGLRGKQHLSWTEAGELQRQGVTFGSHTVTHPKLKALNKNQIEYEIKKSKELIEAKIMESVSAFSNPYAFPQEDKETVALMRTILEGSGYKQGVTTIIGRSDKSDDCFVLKRIPVNSGDDYRLFKAKLEGAYDWLRNLQRFYRVLSALSKVRPGRQPFGTSSPCVLFF